MNTFAYTEEGNAWAYSPEEVTAQEKAVREERFTRLFAALEQDMIKDGLLPQPVCSILDSY